MHAHVTKTKYEQHTRDLAHYIITIFPNGNIYFPKKNILLDLVCILTQPVTVKKSAANKDAAELIVGNINDL